MGSVRSQQHLLAIAGLLVLLFVWTSALQVSYKAPDVENLEENVISRVKRQLEDLDDYSTAASNKEEQLDEPGFWDRVVKVALQLFSKFIEWLNSS